MYLLDVKATVSENEYAKYREAHRSWIRQGIEKGWFIFSGPKKNETGGFILVKNIDKSTLETFIQEDPFVMEKVAEYQIHEFDIAFANHEFERLKNPGWQAKNR